MRAIREQIRHRVEQLVTELLLGSIDPEPVNSTTPAVLFLCVKNGGSHRWRPPWCAGWRQVLRSVDRVVVIGDEAVVEPVPGMTGTIETWQIDEPSVHGIEGERRMRLICDQLTERVTRLADELRTRPGG